MESRCEIPSDQGELYNRLLVSLSSLHHLLLYQRVHRIGQTRTVVGMCPALHLVLVRSFITLTVKTLAIRGTSEEVMDSRSKSLKDNNEEFAKELTGDITVRDFIAVRFLVLTH